MSTTNKSQADLVKILKINYLKLTKSLVPLYSYNAKQIPSISRHWSIVLNDKKATTILPCASPIWKPKVKHKKDGPQMTIFSYGIGFKQPNQKTQMKEGKKCWQTWLPCRSSSLANGRIPKMISAPELSTNMITCQCKRD